MWHWSACGTTRIAKMNLHDGALMSMCRPSGHIVKIYVVDAKMVEVHHVSIFLLDSEDNVF